MVRGSEGTTSTARRGSRQPDLPSAILGGSGQGNRRAGLTVSADTDVRIELTNSENPELYELKSTVSYSFSEPVGETDFVIFATSDPLLREMTVLGCDSPLYELWYISRQDLLRESVDCMRGHVTIGVESRDTNGD